MSAHNANMIESFLRHDRIRFYVEATEVYLVLLGVVCEFGGGSQQWLQVIVRRVRYNWLHHDSELAHTEALEDAQHGEC